MGRRDSSIANWEHQLISRVIRTGDIASIIDWGITPQDFTSSDGRSLYTTILAYHDHPETLGAVWGPQALTQLYPQFQLCDDPGMTVQALCLEIRNQRLKTAGNQLLMELGDLFEQDPQAALMRLIQKGADLQNECATKKTDVHFADGFARAVNEMEMISRGEDVSVCPWPWHPLQNKTMGIRRHDYIVFYGRPKSMKSWVLCYLISWFFSHNKRLLIYTKEMPPDEIFERVGCLVARVDYERFITGSLMPEERASVLAVTQHLDVYREHQMVVCLSAKDAPGGGDTVSWLGSKVERWKPEMVIVDGLYLMRDQQGAKSRHDRVRNISNDLRQLGLKYDVPIIGTVQANREAAKNESANTEDIAFSDSLGQDCTHLIRVINDPDADTISLVMGNVARRFKLNGFRIYGIPATNFSVKEEEISAREADKAVRGDNSNPKKAQKGNKPIGDGNGVSKAVSAINGYMK